MIETIHGPMDEALLIKVESVFNDGHEYTTAVEYHYRGEIVHRSAHVTLKEGLGIEGVLGRLGG